MGEGVVVVESVQDSRSINSTDATISQEDNLFFLTARN